MCVYAHVTGIFPNVERKTERERNTKERDENRESRRDKRREQVDFGMLFTDTICGGRILGKSVFLIS